MQALKDKYDESTASKQKLETELEDLELKLMRAEKLVTGLAGERVRWEASIETFDDQVCVRVCVTAAWWLANAFNQLWHRARNL